MQEDQPLQGGVWFSAEASDDWRPSRSGMPIHDVRQDDESQLMKQNQQDKSFGSVKIKYLNFSNIKSVISTKLESNNGQKRACITYKIDSGADGNLMPFKNFKSLFPKSTIQALHDTRNNSVVLKCIISLILSS